MISSIPAQGPLSFSVGLTGGIGSGKTTVADLFGERGAAIVDTDAIAHQLAAPGGAAIAGIRAAFGDDFINADGAMDRARMRQHVFADTQARKRLESVLHPLIRSETARAAAQARGDYLIYVVPLLVESQTSPLPQGSQSWRSRTARILVVDCTEEIQIARVMRRNGMAREQVEAIMAAQATRDERLAAADDVIENNLDAAALRPQIERLHALYLSLAKTNNAGHL